MALFKSRKKYNQEWKEKAEERASKKGKIAFGTACIDESIPGSGRSFFVARPEGEDRALPVVFDIHGGAFAKGSKEIDRYFCTSFAQKGFAVVGLDFPQAFEADWTTTLRSLIDDIQTILSRKDEFNLDSKNVFLIGHSSGTVFAAALPSLAKNPELRKKTGLDFDIEIRALDLEFPACFINGFKDLEGGRALKKDLFPKNKGLYDLIFKEAKLFPSSGKEFPSLRIVTSAGDEKFEPDGSVLASLLRDRGFDVDYSKTTDTGLGHCFNLDDPDNIESHKINEATAAFFRINLSR